MDKKIQKINYIYLLCYIFVPLMVVSAGFLLGYYLFHDGGAGAVVCFMGFPLVPSCGGPSAENCSISSTAKS